jgi:hypothetical protein
MWGPGGYRNNELKQLIYVLAVPDINKRVQYYHHKIVELYTYHLQESKILIKIYFTNTSTLLLAKLQFRRGHKPLGPYLHTVGLFLREYFVDIFIIGTKLLWQYFQLFCNNAFLDRERPSYST